MFLLLFNKTFLKLLDFGHDLIVEVFEVLVFGESKEVPPNLFSVFQVQFPSKLRVYSLYVLSYVFDVLIMLGKVSIHLLKLLIMRQFNQIESIINISMDLIKRSQC